jgi:hypothetical protein
LGDRALQQVYVDAGVVGGDVARVRQLCEFLAGVADC